MKNRPHISWRTAGTEIEFLKPKESKMKNEKLACGLPKEAFGILRTETPLNRVNYDEATVIFDRMFEMGFKVVPVEPAKP
jgi:hypothetical protein